MLCWELGSLIFLSTVAVVFMQCSYKIDQSNYIGCFTDSSDRLFPFVYKDRIFDNMTNEFCSLACLDSGFQYAGTEGHEWCHCGNDPYNNSLIHPQNPDSHCNQACRGDAQQICGGDWRISIYRVAIKSTMSLMHFETLYTDTGFVNQPMSTYAIDEEQLGSTVLCARFCGDTTGCKVFSYSTSTKECRLNTFLQLCNTIIEQATSIYRLT